MASNPQIEDGALRFVRSALAERRRSSAAAPATHSSPGATVCVPGPSPPLPSAQLTLSTEKKWQRDGLYGESWSWWKGAADVRRLTAEMGEREGEDDSAAAATSDALQRRVSGKRNAAGVTTTGGGGRDGSGVASSAALHGPTESVRWTGATATTPSPSPPLVSATAHESTYASATSPQQPQPQQKPQSVTPRRISYYAGFLPGVLDRTELASASGTNGRRSTETSEHSPTAFRSQRSESTTRGSRRSGDGNSVMPPAFTASGAAGMSSSGSRRRTTCSAETFLPPGSVARSSVVGVQRRRQSSVRLGGGSEAASAVVMYDGMLAEAMVSTAQRIKAHEQDKELNERQQLQRRQSQYPALPPATQSSATPSVGSHRRSTSVANNSRHSVDGRGSSREEPHGNTTGGIHLTPPSAPLEQARKASSAQAKLGGGEADESPQLSHHQLTEAFYGSHKGGQMAMDAYLHFISKSQGNTLHQQRQQQQQQQTQRKKSRQRGSAEAKDASPLDTRQGSTPLGSVGSASPRAPSRGSSSSASKERVSFSAAHGRSQSHGSQGFGGGGGGTLHVSTASPPLAAQPSTRRPTGPSTAKDAEAHGSRKQQQQQQLPMATRGHAEAMASTVTHSTPLDNSINPVEEETGVAAGSASSTATVQVAKRSHESSRTPGWEGGAGARSASPTVPAASLVTAGVAEAAKQEGRSPDKTAAADGAGSCAGTEPASRGQGPSEVPWTDSIEKQPHSPITARDADAATRLAALWRRSELVFQQSQQQHK